MVRCSTDPPESGRLLDALRRCFGLATPPPPWPPQQLLAVRWLHEVASADIAGPLTWSEVVRLHLVPLFDSSDHLVALMSAIDIFDGARELTWERLRRRAEQDGEASDLVPAGTAGWMDAGMFARWLLDNWPTVDELLVLVEPRLTTAARHRMRSYLTGLGVILS